MQVRKNKLFKSLATAGLLVIATAFTAGTPSTAAVAIPGMTFKLKVTLKQTPTSGRAPRAVTLTGRGAFGGGMGRVDIDTVDAPSAFRKGDFIIIRDTLNSFWARPSDLRVRRMNSALQNPLEGISERLTSGTGTPSDLKVVFDTVSLNETLNGHAVSHYRITADATYPVGSRQVQQKVVIEQWLAKIPVRIVNPFGARVRGLPDLPATKGDYRAFLNTLAAANRVYGEAVALKSVTTTSYIYGPGLGEDYFQTVELLDLKQGEIDEKQFQLGAEYSRKAAADSAVRKAAADSAAKKKAAVPVKKPPTT